MGTYQGCELVTTQEFRYGTRTSIVGYLEHGFKHHVEFKIMPKLEFDAYMLDKPTFEAAVREVEGLQNFQHESPRSKRVPLEGLGF